MDNKQQKQAYLRDKILGNNFDPAEFVMFLNSKIPIGDNIDLCSMEQLQAIVQQYIAFKEQQANSFQPLAEMIGSAVQITNPQPKSIPSKLRQILFTKCVPNVLESQFNKSFRCKKIIDKYNHIKSIRCLVSDPERKVIGGILGIGGTSFLEFKVQTFELGWNVGRRYSDFVWLRAYLQKIYPAFVIPPVPEKKASKRTQKHIEKRMKILEHFLNDLVSIREMLNDHFVEGFLSLADNVKFESLKKQADKIPPFANIAQYQSFDGTVSLVLNEENKSFLEQMQKKVPEYQRLYKEITRRGKKLQTIITQEVNTLYQMGNMFADLHELTRETINKLPKCQPITAINDIFITLNNMMIEWGNLTRNQHQFLEKNFNTFFKYVRNQFYGINELVVKQQVLQAEYIKAKQTLQRKKEKIYNLHDPQKWQISSKQLSTIPKQIIHDKAEAFRVMLPIESAVVEKQKINLFFNIQQLYKHGLNSFSRNCDRYVENFKQFAINVKVNNQQLGEMWMQMSASFSGPSKKAKVKKEGPVIVGQQQNIYEEF